MTGSAPVSLNNSSGSNNGLHPSFNQRQSSALATAGESSLPLQSLSQLLSSDSSASFKSHQQTSQQPIVVPKIQLQQLQQNTGHAQRLQTSNSFPVPPTSGPTSSTTTAAGTTTTIAPHKTPNKRGRPPINSDHLTPKMRWTQLIEQLKINLIEYHYLFLTWHFVPSVDIIRDILFALGDFFQVEVSSSKNGLSLVDHHHQSIHFSQLQYRANRFLRALTNAWILPRGCLLSMMSSISPGEPAEIQSILRLLMLIVPQDSLSMHKFLDLFRSCSAILGQRTRYFASINNSNSSGNNGSGSSSNSSKIVDFVSENTLEVDSLAEIESFAK